MNRFRSRPRNKVPAGDLLLARLWDELVDATAGWQHTSSHASQILQQRALDRYTKTREHTTPNQT